MQKLNTLFFSLLFFAISQSLTAQKTYQLDPTHTFINFGVERFMVGEVTGRFNEFSGTIVYNPEDLSQTRMDVSIKVKSIDTGLEVRDGHLKSNIWLDAEKYPEIKFKSKKVFISDGRTQVTADLTIHGITNEVTFPITIKGPFKDPTQTNTLGLSGEVMVNRQDFGISMDKVMTNGHLFIGNEVRISIRALAFLEK